MIAAADWFNVAAIGCVAKDDFLLDFATARPVREDPAPALDVADLHLRLGFLLCWWWLFGPMTPLKHTCDNTAHSQPAPGWSRYVRRRALTMGGRKDKRTELRGTHQRALPGNSTPAQYANAASEDTATTRPTVPPQQQLPLGHDS
mmetsp:Transcript_41818/g.97533  ORF Transcript_41818/g.97533 Transcript_41818/m.97533 type:complete len:146 (-) Transcript_41818:208-645(-)